MTRIIAVLALLAAGPAFAQTPGTFTPNTALSAGALNAALATKADAATTTANVLSLPLTTFTGPDGSPQFGIIPNPGASEYWRVLGGLTGDGATLNATNGTTGNVNGNFAAQLQGGFWFGNGVGGGYLQIQPGDGGPALGGGYTTGIYGTGDLALIPAGFGRIMMAIPDGTAAGGNARGSGALDLQMCRTLASQIVGGANAAIIGGCSNSIQSPNAGGVAGFGNNILGSYSFYGAGINGADDGRWATRIFSSGFLTSLGDRQLAETTLTGVSTASAVVRLTGNAAAASSATKNCWNLPVGKTTAVRVALAGVDVTAAANHVGWFANALIFREAAGTMGVTVGTPEVIGTNTATVALTADGANFCLNASITADNADTWHWTMTLYAAETK